MSAVSGAAGEVLPIPGISGAGVDQVICEKMSEEQRAVLGISQTSLTEESNKHSLQAEEFFHLLDQSKIMRRGTVSS